MANFENALDALQIDEGGYTVDEGGETYEGISRKSWPAWSGWAILDALPAGLLRQGIVINGIPELDQAVAGFYQQNFWKFGALPDQALANKIFSLYVNLAGAGIKVVQLALLAISDGIRQIMDPVWQARRILDEFTGPGWGPRTQAAVIAADPQQLMHAIRFCQVLHYLASDANRPGEINGLLWRATE